MTINESKRFRFTKKAVDAIKPYDGKGGSRDAEYTDTEVPGLKLCVTKAGRKSFLLRYTINDKKLSMKLGDYGVLDVDEARKRAQEARRKILDGIDPKPLKVAVNDVPNFREFVTRDYLPHARLKKDSYDDDESKFRNHLNDWFGDMKMPDINSRSIQAYLRYLLEDKNLAPATVNRHQSLLSVIFKMAILYEVVEKNPCSGIDMQEENNTIERYLSLDELKRLLAAMDAVGDEAEQNRTAVNVLKFLLLTGTRREEALKARWSEINLKKRTWHLPDTKNGKPRTVSLSKEAHDLLSGIDPVDGCEYVFVNPETNKRLDNPWKAFNRLKAKAGIENFRIHDLRHSYASFAVNNNVDLFQVSKLLGHRSIKSTQRYAHLADETLRKATDVVGSYVKDAKTTIDETNTGVA